jgi:hypothetical protein
MSAESSFNSASLGTASSIPWRSQTARRRSVGNTFHPQEESDDQKRKNKHRADAADCAIKVADCALQNHLLEVETQKMKCKEELMKALEAAESNARVHRRNGKEVPPTEVHFPAY